METLTERFPKLKKFIAPNKYGNFSINFFDPEAVKCLNQALLLYYYDIHWDIPNNYLCPPIPGRADHLHYIASFLEAEGMNINGINCLDIGTGANCVYPIIGTNEYHWNFVATDIDPTALESAHNLKNNNPSKLANVYFRLQKNRTHIFKGILKTEDQFQLSVCNPPFHSSKAEADKGTLRKLNNLKNKKSGVRLNFSGKSNELWCPGGELQFIRQMIHEGKIYRNQIDWLSSLISKKENIPTLLKELKKTGVSRHELIPIEHGNKKSRILIWKYRP